MPDFDATQRLLTSHSPDATRDLGAALGRAIASTMMDRPILIALNGELGAGKTTFVGGLLRALGVTTPVRSPTYTLIESYEFAASHVRRMHHLDLYRLADADELEMLAPRDLLEPGSVLLVEWAERGTRALPVPDLTLTFCYPEHSLVGSATDLDRTLKVGVGSSAGRVLAESLH